MRKRILVLLVVTSFFLGAAIGYVSWIGPGKVIEGASGIIFGTM